MTTSGPLDKGHSGSCADPKWLIVKVVVGQERIAR